MNAPRTKTVLVTDDDRSLLNLLEYKLGAHGFRVLTARTGEEFREKALGEKPDLIILDIWLGSSNGALVYDEILGRGFDAGVPIIFLSGLAQDRPPSPALRPGRKVLLRTKPFDIDELVREVETLTEAAA